MSYLYDPHQIPLFPDLFEDYLPPLTSQPDFAQALDNFVKIADYGALLELNFKGIEKSYSIRKTELKIPVEYLKSAAEEISPVFYLFPAEIRRELEHFRYRFKAFFDRHNSIKTSHGYFLFRNHTLRWERFRAAQEEELRNYLQQKVGVEYYKECFDSMFKTGLEWLSQLLKPVALYQKDFPGHAAVVERRRELIGQGATLASLNGNDASYLLDIVVLKTMHIPSNLGQYLKGLAILSVYKTIHLDYLRNIKVESLRDVKDILAQIDKSRH